MIKRLLFMFAFALAAPGCYFKGHEGYICKSTSDCEPGLECRAFSYKNDTRNACVPPGTSSIGSKSTYTDFAVYLAWIATVGVPIGLAAMIIKERRDKARAAK